MHLNDIDAPMEQDLKRTVLRSLARDGLPKWLQGLLVEYGPKVVLAVLKEVWQAGYDEDACAGGWEVDRGGLLHHFTVGEDGEKVRVVELDGWVGLEA